VIDFAVKRIRQRREQHDLLVEELRKQLKNAGLRSGDGEDPVWAIPDNGVVHLSRDGTTPAMPSHLRASDPSLDPKRACRVHLNGADHQWGKDPLKEVVG
jgi:hypothetical protein